MIKKETNTKAKNEETKAEEVVQEPQKPITLVIRDFKQELVELINNCPLPVFLIDEILSQISSQVSAQAAMQLKADEEAYVQSQNQAK